MKIFRFLFFIFIFNISILNLTFAKEITILYTGSTHAMLYPCKCPLASDGGLSRRSTLIKELRKKYPDLILLDAGSFFAGGPLDEYTQNQELDKKRTLFNLKAMELMGYDAVAVGEDEFNFGRGFLEEIISKTKIGFLSCNIKSEKFLPYIIKQIKDMKIGIIGVSRLFDLQKLDGLEIIEPSVAVKNTVEQLKQKDVDLIVLLGELSSQEEDKIIREVKGIDLLIEGYNTNRKDPFAKIGSLLIVNADWQGKSLGKLTLKIENNKIVDYKVELIRLSDKIKDDPKILEILPSCFSDTDCRKEGFIGKCQDPAEIYASCLYTKPSKVELLVIIPKNCRVCQTENFINYLKRLFIGLVVNYLYYPDKKAEKFIKEFNIHTLPAYLLSKEINKEKNFGIIQPHLLEYQDFFLVKPEFSGLSYLLARERKKERLDVFISLYDKNTAKLLDLIKDFNPQLHFLAKKQNENFEALRGNLEVEEYLRSVCVKKYFPQDFWDYIKCRTNSINSSWWQDCLSGYNAEKEKVIKNCAQGKEGKTLLEENIALNEELKIMFGPVFLWENQEIFSIQELPSKEELERIIKK